MLRPCRLQIRPLTELLLRKLTGVSANHMALIQGLQEQLAEQRALADSSLSCPYRQLSGVKSPNALVQNLKSRQCAGDLAHIPPRYIRQIQKAVCRQLHSPRQDIRQMICPVEPDVVPNARTPTKPGVCYHVDAGRRQAGPQGLDHGLPGNGVWRDDHQERKGVQKRTAANHVVPPAART